MSKEKLLYKAFLPNGLKVKIHEAEEGGFWAEVLDLPGCNTQGETLSELIDMINDAVYVYLGIPTKLMPELGTYLPVSLFRKRHF